MMAFKINRPKDNWCPTPIKLTLDNRLSRDAKSVYTEIYAISMKNEHSKNMKETISYLATLAAAPHGGQSQRAGEMCVRKALNELIRCGWLSETKPTNNRRGKESDYELLINFESTNPDGAEPVAVPKMQPNRICFPNSPLHGALGVMNCRAHFGEKYPECDYQWYIDNVIRWLANNPDFACIDWFVFLENKIADARGHYKRITAEKPEKPTFEKPKSKKETPKQSINDFDTFNKIIIK